jgi:protein-L-isoaspartate(D-aspartate) O-methyltransferase
MLRFGRPCTKDAAVSGFFPRQLPLGSQGTPEGTLMSGFTIARQKMVDGQVRPSDVTDIRIIDAMLAVPREAFVPPGQQAMAYLDIDLDVSAGPPETKRYLIKPVVTAKMLQAAEIRDTDNVLVVGCATGYSAAIVAKLAAKVTATEGDASLAAKAKDVLAGLGFANVTVRAAPAAEGDAANAPYDVIMLNGATEVTPAGLYRQLKDGGRLVGVFAMMQPQRATLVTHSHADFGTRALFDAAVPVLPGLGRLPAFIF